MNILFTILISLGLFQVPTDWKAFIEKDNLFTILFPGDMEVSEKLLETSTGDVLFNYVFHQSHVDSTENYLYLVNYHEIEKELYALDSMDMNHDFLQIMVDDIAFSMQAEIIYTHKVFHDAFPALDYRLSIEKGEKLIKGKLILSYDHLYNLQVYTISKYSLNKNMDRFISSFVLKLQ